MESGKGKANLLHEVEPDDLFKILKTRFSENIGRHPGLEWAKVQERLDKYPDKLRSLVEMEKTGGEPDVVDFDAATGQFIFMDCSAETPIGRRSICYDRQGLEERKEHRPETTAVDMATAMGIDMLAEAQYRALQELGEFDLRTSSWIQTPPEIRKLGGALFADRRYGRVFVYHNGAQSYYGVRGFRGMLRV
jgi:hypothetical protein